MAELCRYLSATKLANLEIVAFAAAMLVANPLQNACAASEQAMFDRPEMAVDALLDSLKNGDVDGLAKLFGQEQWDQLVGPDKSQAREGLLRIHEAG